MAKGKRQTADVRRGGPQKAAKLALELSRKYNKPAMAMALANLLQFGNRLPFHSTLKDSLENTKDIKMSHIKDIAEGN